MKLGFIGLGVMGRPMAQHLLAAGHRLFAHSRSGVPEDLQAAGAVTCGSPRDVAAQAEVIFLMLPDTPDVEGVLHGSQGIGEALVADQVVVDMSSISPIATREFALHAAQKGVIWMDAPVSGGEVGAKSASLTIMVGGDEIVFERIRPLLALMGRNINRIGPVGAGQIAKVANQMIVAINIQGVSEALLFAARAGADPASVRAALMGGFAASRVLEVHGQRMLQRRFEPGFRIALHQKDLGLALESARHLGLGLPATALAQQMFSSATAQGAAALDHSAMVQALEAMAAHTVDAAAP
ncbi:2-hydroxy-3-oxopropionate reductase [Hydrogenophaga sp.]|jgi:2-hydroxy-3-oxopropionate reductase|uniref:2-hydroxy-3-oxopropionate reductase n=1 Tax=Hydrogenophaga sp. TaxID=1904254 RepID=UPI003F6FBC23